jgi:hypothetical protein
MKTVQINIYQFGELSETAKNKAREWYKDLTAEEGFSWSQEAYQSIRDFCKIFGIKYISSSFSTCSEAEVSFSGIDDSILELKGKRLIAYLWNNHSDLIIQRKTKHFCRMSDGTKRFNCVGLNSGKYVSKCQYETSSCPITGVCFDENLLEPIKLAVKKGYSGTFGGLLQECIDSWVKYAEQDCEAQLSDEFVDEQILANEYQFTEDGKRY